jgi:hypothetical protein
MDIQDGYPGYPGYPDPFSRLHSTTSIYLKRL